jgi:hypothetical protein
MRVPRFHFDGPATVSYDSSQGCATNSIDDVLSFSISKPKQCNKSGSHGSSPRFKKRTQLSNVAYEASLEGVDSKDGSFVRTCPADEMREKMREKRKERKDKKNEESPQGYLDEEFDYDVVTTYAKSDKCTGEAIRMERMRTHCKQITAKDLWWNWMRKRTTNTCDATSVFVSDYCGSTLPEPVLRKERFDRMKREERERMEKERKDKKNKGEDEPEREESEVGASSSSSSSATSNSVGTAVIIGSIVGSLVAIAMIAIGLHIHRTRRAKQTTAQPGTASSMAGLA